LQSSNAAQEDTAWERSCVVFFAKKRKIVKSSSLLFECDESNDSGASNSQSGDGKTVLGDSNL